MRSNAPAKSKICAAVLIFVLVLLAVIAVLDFTLSLVLLCLLVLLTALMYYLMPDKFSSTKGRKVSLDDLIDTKSKTGAAAVRYCLVDCDTQRVIADINHSPFTLGREANNDLRINFRMVTKHHCQIFFRRQDQRYYLKDLGSRNGTFHNGHFLPNTVPVPLNHRDIIRVGPKSYRFMRRS